MVQSFSKLLLHITFSTKLRRPWLADVSKRTILYARMAAEMRRVRCPAIIINGVEDHVHLLCHLSRTVALMDLVKSVKIASTKWIKRNVEGAELFAWQAGYGAFSVSESRIPIVVPYIENQVAHHLTVSFQDELRELCRQHGVELDETHAWG